MPERFRLDDCLVARFVRDGREDIRAAAYVVLRHPAGQPTSKARCLFEIAARLGKGCRGEGTSCSGRHTRMGEFLPLKYP